MTWKCMYKMIMETAQIKISNIETIETEGEEIYKCSVCEFKTTHNPGLKVIWQKSMDRK